MAVRATEGGYTFRIDADASGFSFSGLQRLPVSETPAYIVWVSGGSFSGIVNVMRTADGRIEFSGMNVVSGISHPINAIARGGTGGKVGIKDGFYPLNDTSIVVSGDNIIIEGEGKQQTILRASGDFPIFTIRGGSNFIELRDLDLTHNITTNSGIGLLELIASGGVITGCTVRDCAFTDAGTKVGNAIVLRNGSGFGIYNNVFDRIQTEGFENAIFADSAGSGSTTFINSNNWINCYFNQGKRVLLVKNGILGAFDNNNFTNCVYQAYAGTEDAFDYEAENSGHSYYTVHTNTMVWDLTGTMMYARINNQTEIQMYGCLPTYRISGLGISGYGTGSANRIIRKDKYVTNEGVFVGSGNNSTTAYAFAHALVNPPINIQVTPMTPQARTSLFDVSGGATNITVTYGTAPTSGTVKLSWTAQV